MVDLLYVATIIGFFALMVAFVRWCEHIIGKDDPVDFAYDGIEDDADDNPRHHGSTTPEPEEVPA